MNDKHLLWYDKPASFWTQALPIGNGKLGGMVYGGMVDEKISLNHDELWSGKPGHNYQNPDHPDYDRKQAYLKARELVLEGKKLEAEEILEEYFHGYWSDVYMPLGDLNIHTERIDSAYDYKRELDISSAVSKVSFKCHSTTFTRECFASNPDKAIAVKLTNDSEDGHCFTVDFSSVLKHDISYADNTLIIDGECPIKIDGDSGNGSAHIYDENEKGVCFRAAIKVVAPDAEIRYANGKLRIFDCNEAYIYFCAESSFNGFDKHPSLEGKEYKNACIEMVNSISAKSFEEIKQNHINDYKAIYDRMDLDLCGKDMSNVTTDERLRLFQNDKSDKNLYILLYNYGRYLLIASSRKDSQPGNLQGIWNDRPIPPWRSNYTININTQMNYWPALMCNMSELNLPLIEMIKDLSIQGEQTAMDFYGAPGFVSHHNTDLWRITHPVPGSSSWSFWPGSSGWFCQHLFDHYEYTNDVSFLKDTAYPIMKKAAEFYSAMLIEDKDGYLIFAPSTSPENCFVVGDDECPLSQTTTMTMGIIRALFKNLIKSAEILEIDDSFINVIKDQTEKLLPYRIGSRGELLEWYEEEIEAEPDHRHTSHLYSLHPANLITKEETPELFDACKRTLELRGDDGTGWSLGWKINFWARLLDGDHALILLNNQLRYKDETVQPKSGGGTYSNLFDAHPPFQIDGNFGAVSGITEMLLRSIDNKIYLLPALPSEWKNGSVRGLKAKGNITVDISWENGIIKDYNVSNKENVEIFYKGSKLC